MSGRKTRPKRVGRLSGQAKHGQQQQQRQAGAHPRPPPARSTVGLLHERRRRHGGRFAPPRTPLAFATVARLFLSTLLTLRARLILVVRCMRFVAAGRGVCAFGHDIAGRRVCGLRRHGPVAGHERDAGRRREWDGVRRRGELGDLRGGLGWRRSDCRHVGLGGFVRGRVRLGGSRGLRCDHGSGRRLRRWPRHHRLERVEGFAATPAAHPAFGNAQLVLHDAEDGAA